MVENKGSLHKGHRQRLKNRASKSLETMPYHEILELLLTYTIPYKDVNPLAHELIARFGSLGGVLDAGYDQLLKCDGVGHETALFLSLLPEIYIKYSSSKHVGRVVLNNVSSCINYFRSIANIKKVEEFYVFCLDAKKRLVKTLTVNGGNASSVSVDLSYFTESVSAEGISSIVIMHIHTGSSIYPTRADLIATKRLVSVCYMLGINVEDHIIVGEQDYYSFVSNGLFHMLSKDVSKSLVKIIGIDDLEYESIRNSFKNKKTEK